MPEVMINSGGVLGDDAPCVEMLRSEGFVLRLVHDAELAGGLKADDEAIEILRGVSAVVAWGENYPARVIESLPDLRVIARMGVGFDKVDISAATARGVVVTITPTANHEAVAEHALALMLAVAKSLVTGDRGMRSGAWPAQPRAPLRGSTLGIVGLGRIGRSLALLAQAMGMDVVAVELAPDKAFVHEHGIRLLDLEALLEIADYVSLNCPLMDDTRGMINGDRLSRMKRDAVLVNTARGGLVVEADLVEALKSGAIGGAGLDVFQVEPTDGGNPLFRLDNVVVSPHVAGNDTLAMERMSIEAAQSIIDLSGGVWPEDAVVNTELKGRWRW